MAMKVLAGIMGLICIAAGILLYFMRRKKKTGGGFSTNATPQWIFDKETLAFLAVNKAAMQLYGYSEDEFRHMTIKDIRPAWDIKKLEAHIYSHALYGSNTGVWKHLTKKGDVILVRLSAEDILHQGKMQRLITVENITPTSTAFR